MEKGFRGLGVMGLCYFSVDIREVAVGICGGPRGMGDGKWENGKPGKAILDGDYVVPWEILGRGICTAVPDWIEEN